MIKVVEYNIEGLDVQYFSHPPYSALHESIGNGQIGLFKNDWEEIYCS